MLDCVIEYMPAPTEVKAIEGVLEDGDVLCLVDDLVTGLTSKVTARAQVRAELDRRGIQNATCDDIAVLVDRQQGASEAAKNAGMKLHSLIGFVDCFDDLFN